MFHGKVRAVVSFVLLMINFRTVDGYLVFR
jgi:hypothetical protein